MKTHLILLLFSTTTIFFGESHVAGGTKVPHIRGIPVSKSPLYPTDRDFQCLDGSLIIPFSYVNDDYCDCADGSDEPGTAACTNGSFYCQNLGHQATYIPSMRVNDGVCDCCDASDEYNSEQKCLDNCHELGREARLAAQRIAELAREGNKIRLEMISRGKQIKGEYQTRLTKLRTDYEEAERLKKEKELLKKQAEEREEVALAKYKTVEAEKPAGSEHESDVEVEAREYFALLDSDSSGTVTISELQTRVTFDKDRNGEVSEEEALYFLNNLKEITMKEFIESAWSNIKPFLMLEKGLFKARGEEEEDEEEEEEENEGEEEHAQEVSDDKVTEDEEADGHESHGEDLNEEEETGDAETETAPTVQYDEETQALIDEATNARQSFDEADKMVRDLHSEIRKLEDKMERDYGPEEEFAALDGECFEYVDVEYIYTLCMFDRATQKSKSGGSDISLGMWHDWTGPEGGRFTRMKYDRGLTCWNGPARFTIVSLTCGTENKITSVSEPSRCEYAFEFVTPVVCNASIDSNDTHDEL